MLYININYMRVRTHTPVSKMKETLGRDFVKSRRGGQNQKACHIFYLFCLLLVLTSLFPWVLSTD